MIAKQFAVLRLEHNGVSLEKRKQQEKGNHTFPHFTNSQNPNLLFNKHKKSRLLRIGSII